MPLMSGFRHCPFFYVTVVKSVFRLENKIYKKLADMFHIIHDWLSTNACNQSENTVANRANSLSRVETAFLVSSDVQSRT